MSTSIKYKPTAGDPIRTYVKSQDMTCCVCKTLLCEDVATRVLLDSTVNVDRDYSFHSYLHNGRIYFFCPGEPNPCVNLFKLSPIIYEDNEPVSFT